MTPDLPCPAVLEFRIDGNPPHITNQAGIRTTVRFGRAFRYKRSDYARQEKNMVAVILSKLPRGWKPLEGPLELRLKFVEFYRKAEKKCYTREGVELPRDTKPDIDNWSKGCVDSLTMAGAWRDDSQLARMVLEKAWGPRPYWYVRIAKLDPGAMLDTKPSHGLRRVETCCATCRWFERDYEDAMCLNPRHRNKHGGGEPTDEGMVCDFWAPKRDLPGRGTPPASDSQGVLDFGTEGGR